MSAASFPSRKPLLTYSLVLPHLSADADEQASQSTHGYTGRLYFSVAETSQPHPSPGQDASRAVESLREAITQAEKRECPLHRIHLEPSHSAGVADAQNVLYAESTRSAARTQSAAEHNECEAMLTSCPQVLEAPLQPNRCYEAATVAPLCVFQDLCERSVADWTFWNFLGGVLRHGIHENASDAAVAGVRGSVLSIYEGTDNKAFCVDAFADTDADKLPGEVAGKIMAIDSGVAVDNAIVHLQHALQQAEEHHGSSLLVVEVTWRMISQLRQQLSATSAPPPLNELDQKTCIVWLRNASNGSNEDGVYADAALEMLLDELTLAAATTQTAQEASAVLEEAGVKWFFDSCSLMRKLRGLLHTHFLGQCMGERPLYHWIVCAPPSFSRRLHGCVARCTFRGSTDAALDDFWCVLEEVEHWKEVLAVATAPSNGTTSSMPTGEPATEKTPAKVLSPLSLNTYLRQHVRVSRQRRAIRQSGHQSLSASLDGSALSRQRCKLNVPKLYGFEEGDALQESRGAISLGSSYAASGVFHHTRSSSNTSFCGTSLLEADETIGHITRRTARLVKRPKSAAKSSELDVR